MYALTEYVISEIYSEFHAIWRENFKGVLNKSTFPKAFSSHYLSLLTFNLMHFLCRWACECDGVKFRCKLILGRKRLRLGKPWGENNYFLQIEHLGFSPGLGWRWHGNMEAKGWFVKRYSGEVQ